MVRRRTVPVVTPTTRPSPRTHAVGGAPAVLRRHRGRAVLATALAALTALALVGCSEDSSLAATPSPSTTGRAWDHAPGSGSS